VPRRSNSQQSAQRRAVQELRKAGLIVILSEEERIYKQGRLAGRIKFIAPTALGEYVVGACAEELRSHPGKHIRWSRKLPSIRAAFLQDCGCVPAEERARHL
jgi:hypothetical protein